jgi:BirA family biotin operon repressor/biotin-[acetyl-CoA-carboxylase] ligase
LADRGTLCFTLVEQSASYGLRPRTLPQLALIVGLAVAEAIERLCPTLQPRIKWPNDIYVADGKVAGVLVETARHASPRVAIGVGINVATEVDRLEPRLRGAARSLSEVVGEKLDRFALLEHFLARLAAQQSASRDRSAALELPQASQLRDRCYLTGHDVTLRSGNQQLRGHCVGIDDDGALRLRTGDRVLRVVSGEVVRTEASRAG